MALPRPLAPEMAQVIAHRFKVLSAPNRVRMLELLDRRERSVDELARLLGASRQSVGRHVALLYRSGIVSRHGTGDLVTYRLEDWTCWWLVEQAAQSLNAPRVGSDGDA